MQPTVSGRKSTTGARTHVDSFPSDHCRIDAWTTSPADYTRYSQNLASPSACTAPCGPLGAINHLLRTSEKISLRFRVRSVDSILCWKTEAESLPGPNTSC